MQCLLRLEREHLISVLCTSTAFQIALWEFSKHFNPWSPRLGQGGGGKGPRRTECSLHSSLTVWQDLFLGQERLVVTAVDKQLERKEEGVATGPS